MGTALNPQTGQMIQFEDNIDKSGVNQTEQEAESKGWQIVHQVQNPKTGETIHVEKSALNEAIKKGWQLPEVTQAKQEYTKALQPNTFESGISGAADVMSMGFGDELSGAASAANTALHGGNLNEIGSAYTKNRDISRDIEKNAAEQHPMAHLVGQGAGLVTGIAAGGLASGGEAAAEATPTILGKIGQGAAQGAKLGAGLGAVGGAGESEATLGSKEFFGDVAKGTGEGALTGGALGGAGSALSEGTQAGSKALKKSLFSATKAEKGQNFGNEALNELGEKATPKLQKDADILTEDGTFSKVNDSKGMYKDSFQKQQQYGQQISDMLQGKENDATRYEYKNLQNLLNSKPSDSPERIIIQKNIDSLKNTVENTPDLASINAEKSKYYNSLKTSDFSNPNISTTAEIEKAKAADLREGIINNFINSDVKASDANKFVDLNSRWGAHQNLLEGLEKIEGGLEPSKSWGFYDQLRNIVNSSTTSKTVAIKVLDFLNKVTGHGVQPGKWDADVDASRGLKTPYVKSEGSPQLPSGIKPPNASEEEILQLNAPKTSAQGQTMEVPPGGFNPETMNYPESVGQGFQGESIPPRLLNAPDGNPPSREAFTSTNESVNPESTSKKEEIIKYLKKKGYKP